MYRSDNTSHLNQYAVENIFGCIWIDNAEEFDKLASAVNNYAFEEDGEVIAYTDNYFYAYYRNINAQIIPYPSVYLNEAESQDVVKQVNQDVKNWRKEKGAKEYFDTAVARYELLQSANNADNGNNSSTSDRRRNVQLGNILLQKGTYYSRPYLYVKTRRADSVAERSGGGIVSDEGVTMASDQVSKALGEQRYGRGNKMREYAERQRRFMVHKV